VVKILNAVLNKRVSFLACSQIWLNLPVDYSNFGYITKSTACPPKQKKQAKKTLKLCIKSWPVGFELKPSFYAPSPLGFCPQCHEILLN
jgi:hypothetical protein